MHPLVLLACSAEPDPGGTGGDDTDLADTGGDSGDSGDTGDTGDTDDTGADLPLGDNLALLGGARADGLLESTGVLVLDETHVALCAGASPLAIYDVSDPAAPRSLGQVTLPAPGGGFRCQHLASNGEGRLLVSHHGDETGDGWLGLVDVSDPTAPLGLAGWRQAGVAPEGIAAEGTSAWVAAHGDGVLRFDLSADGLAGPVAVEGVTGNAYSVAIGPDHLAIGTVEGDVQLLDRDGAVYGTVAASGPVHDLAWLADGSLVAACGSSGLDRIDPASLAVVAHTDGHGSALDVGVLGDGNLAVAGWADVRVYEPDALGLLGAEDPAEPGADAAVLALDAAGDALYVGEWHALLVYRWDPGVSAPDLRVDLDSIDFGDLPAGSADPYVIGVLNEGPRPLTVSAIEVSEPALTVAPTAFVIDAGGVQSVEVSWTSTGAPLAAHLTVVSDDPDEGAEPVAVYANRGGVGVGDLLPAFAYFPVNGTDLVDSASLGGPALLSYFATF